jgi:hypothetical protein
MARVIAVVAMLAMLGACTSRTEFGKCVGLGQKQDPTLEYQVSAWNVVMGIVFFEMLLPPIFVATDELYCPIGKTQEIK